METLMLIKPDITSAGRIGEIISALEQAEYNITNIKMFRPTLNLAQEHYIEHSQKDFFNPLCVFLTSGTVVALIIQGDNIISRIREEIPVLRKMFGTDFRKNAVHASDGPESAEREIKLWFN